MMVVVMHLPQRRELLALRVPPMRKGNNPLYTVFIYLHYQDGEGAHDQGQMHYIRESDSRCVEFTVTSAATSSAIIIIDPLAGLEIVCHCFVIHALDSSINTLAVPIIGEHKFSDHYIHK